jgi:hypothetical protein
MLSYLQGLFSEFLSQNFPPFRPSAAAFISSAPLAICLISLLASRKRFQPRDRGRSPSTSPGTDPTLDLNYLAAFALRVRLAAFFRRAEP